ncbi:hypothetical protein J3R82DRAFT_11811 [Butyriboletus roseoflavus]|nr:hypothetical protein J3R82DRAFT_11811 [Butyriboletus roseoflavus]
MICTRCVFRCFKWMERAGDRITGAAGPYFVGLAVILISIGVLSFWFVDDPPRYPGTSFLWASPTAQKGLSTLGSGLEIVDASFSRCKRCRVHAPRGESNRRSLSICV